MKIVFLNGSEVVEKDIERRLERKLRTLVKNENKVSFLFHPGRDWMLTCEWVARKLEASLPHKEVKRIGILCAEESYSYTPPTRYSQTKILDQTALKDRTGIWGWMIDQADYAVIYYDQFTCCEQNLRRVYQYAITILGERCINLCSGKGQAAVRAHIPQLPWWQRRTVEGRLRKEPKKLLADVLQVSRSTIRSYETQGIRSIVDALKIPMSQNRSCAVLGFTCAQLAPDKLTELFYTALYLVYCCGINRFILPQGVYLHSPKLMHTLQLVCSMGHDKVSLCHLIPSDRNERDTCDSRSRDPLLCYGQKADSIVARRFEERKAMIDRADIILCYVATSYRSGIAYARKKHIPIIDFTDIVKTES